MLCRVTISALVLAFSACGVSAAEGPRLVLGGLGGGEVRSDLYVVGATRLGALSEVVSPLTFSGRDRLALGGYVTYDLNDYRFNSSVRSGEGSLAADLSASTATPVLGIAGTTQLRLGADWTRPQAFSLNASQPGLAGFEGYRPSGDLSLSLSWTRDITPGLSLGGVAGATRPLSTDADAGGFVLGAGLGYRF
jgi:hypothetical protein